MQLTKMKQTIKQKLNPSAKHAAIISLFFAISACGNSADSAASPDHGSNQSANSGSAYQVETVTKPENFAQYVNWYKQGYDGCVNFAKLRNLPVKPFVNVPADFIIDRDIYISDGKNYLHRTMSNQIQTKDATPENGCTTSIAKTETLRAVKNGKYSHIDVLESGERVAQPAETATKSGLENAGIYTVAKLVNGFNLKCMPDDATTAALGQVCVIEKQGQTNFADYDGKYITGYARMLATQDQFGVLITSPVSISSNPKIDSNLFNIK